MLTIELEVVRLFPVVSWHGVTPILATAVPSLFFTTKFCVIRAIYCFIPSCVKVTSSLFPCASGKPSAIPHSCSYYIFPHPQLRLRSAPTHPPAVSWHVKSKCYYIYFSSIPVVATTGLQSFQSLLFGRPIPLVDVISATDYFLLKVLLLDRGEWLHEICLGCVTL